MLQMCDLLEVLHGKSDVVNECCWSDSVVTKFGLHYKSTEEEIKRKEQANIRGALDQRRCKSVYYTTAIMYMFQLSSQQSPYIT